MTNPVSNSSPKAMQVLEERKRVSWGNTVVVVVEPSCHIPEGCSSEVEQLARQLLSSRADLKDALKHFEDSGKRVKVIKNLRQIITATTKEADPLSKKILCIAHILLARAYVGFLSDAFQAERQIIENDPEMKQQYPQWQQLLTSDSIFI